MIDVPPFLSQSKKKRDLFGVDTYFREAWEDFVDLAGASDAQELLTRWALAVFKPEAVVARVIPRAIELLAADGFTPVAAAPFRYNRHMLREAWRYQFNIATRERMAIVDRILLATDSLCVAFVTTPSVDGVPASVRLSVLKGPSPPHRRKPFHLRARLGPVQSTLLSYLHCSDSPADLLRELGVYFASEERRRMLQKLLDAEDRTEDVLSAARRLHERFAPHDLSLVAALDRLEAAVRSHHAQTQERDEDLQELTKLCQGIRAGTERDWQRTLHVAGRAGVRLAEWDALVIGTELTISNVPGLEAVLETEDASAWTTAPEKAPLVAPVLQS